MHGENRDSQQTKAHGVVGKGTPEGKAKTVVTRAGWDPKLPSAKLDSDDFTALVYLKNLSVNLAYQVKPSWVSMGMEPQLRAQKRHCRCDRGHPTCAAPLGCLSPTLQRISLLTQGCEGDRTLNFDTNHGLYLYIIMPPRESWPKIIKTFKRTQHLTWVWLLSANLPDTSPWGPWLCSSVSMSSKWGLLLRGECLLGREELGYIYHITICRNRRGSNQVSHIASFRIRKWWNSQNSNYRIVFKRRRTREMKVLRIVHQPTP